MKIFGLFVAVLLLLAAPSAFAQSVCPIRSHVAVTVTGTADTVSGQDLCRTKVYTSSSSVAITLPYVTALGSGYNFWTNLFMEGTGSATITPSAPAVSGSAPTINGGATLSLASGQSAVVAFGTDGKWYATTGAGGSGAAGAAGVTCATGSPSASFATVGGIVTHC